MVFKKGESGNKATQFQPGQSGNPAGMKKGFVSFKKAIRELAEKEINYKDLDNKQVRVAAGEALVTALLGKAIYKQDTQAAKIIMEHLEGTESTVNVEGTIGEWLQGRWGKDDDKGLL